MRCWGTMGKNTTWGKLGKSVLVEPYTYLLYASFLQITEMLLKHFLMLSHILKCILYFCLTIWKQFYASVKNTHLCFGNKILKRISMLRNFVTYHHHSCSTNKEIAKYFQVQQRHQHMIWKSRSCFSSFRYILAYVLGVAAIFGFVNHFLPSAYHSYWNVILIISEKMKIYCAI